MSRGRGGTFSEEKRILNDLREELRNAESHGAFGKLFFIAAGKLVVLSECAGLLAVVLRN